MNNVSNFQMLLDKINQLLEFILMECSEILIGKDIFKSKTKIKTHNQSMSEE